MVTKILSSREEMLLEYLWEIDRPVTTSELSCLLSKDDWKKITIFKTIQSLCDKGFVEVTGFEKNVKTYARKLSPALTRSEFYAMKFSNNHMDEKLLIDITAAMVGGVALSKSDKDALVIEKLENIIESIKKEQKE